MTAQKKLRVLMESMVMKIWHVSRMPMNAPLTRDMNQENNEHYDAGRQSATRHVTILREGERQKVLRAWDSGGTGFGSRPREGRVLRGLWRGDGAQARVVDKRRRYLRRARCHSSVKSPLDVSRPDTLALQLIDIVVGGGWCGPSQLQAMIQNSSS